MSNPPNAVDDPEETEMPDTSSIKCYQCNDTMPRTLYLDHEATHDRQNAERAQAAQRWTIAGDGSVDTPWTVPAADPIPAWEWHDEDRMYRDVGRPDPSMRARRRSRR